MHSATTATGRPLPPPGKTLPKNRPAPLSCRAAHQLAAQKPHVTSQLQCYIPPLIDNHRRAPHSSRNTCRPRIATPLLDTNGRFRRSNNSRNSFKTNDRVNSHSIQTSTPLAAKCTTAGNVSNRQWQILEITVNLSKQTIAPGSNRHKNAFFASRMGQRDTVIKRQKSPITIACHESPITSHASRQRFSEHSGAWLCHTPIGRLAFPGYG